MFSRASKRKDADICAVFVHAGAGYHSRDNEIYHLSACSDAARAAMAMLKEGASATDGVEMAIKVLEDRVITNSGYGSNLCMDGTVECDATIVDHCGRSGAVGAVSQIKNPISLARLLLDRSLNQMTLRRIPPNLLVGEGAVDYAAEHGVPVLPHDCLVSDGARSRYVKWKLELEKAESEDNGSTELSPSQQQHPYADLGFEEYARQRSRADHLRNMYDAVLRRKLAKASRGRKSPPRHTEIESASRPQGSPSAPELPHSLTANGQSTNEFVDPLGPPGFLSQYTRGGLEDSIHFHNAQDSDNLANPQQSSNTDQSMEDETMVDAPHETLSPETELTGFVQHDGQPDSDPSSSSSSSSGSLRLPSLSPSPPSAVYLSAPAAEDREAVPSNTAARSSSPRRSKAGTTAPRQDAITDTVGVIAVDSHGRIAAGSSSGGIGMKHRGRVGPAALVGIGSAVVPLDPEDKERTCVGVVTSGTGEHIATTMAASMCADRLYSNIRKTRRGKLESSTEDAIMESFVKNDFMAHPGVKFSSSEGAIGIMAVKMNRDGIYTYFAHNTESFALASMHSGEAKPMCIMSRSHSEGSTTLGARSMKYGRTHSQNGNAPT